MTSKATLLVCIHQRSSNASCGGRGSEQLLPQLNLALDKAKLKVRIEPIHCFGRCQQGPIVRIAPGGAFFSEVTPESIPQIITELRQAIAAASSQPERS
ncbi:MAG: (2Fe-2S) ferredoxin domain-containing protein [Gammaproteobacteria bacterium]|nr:(2Fe-2S) ferredoxin domain-containing protein [Gammaproteobacteria bacterium]